MRKENKTKAQLLADIEVLEKKIENLERYEKYDAMADEVKAMTDSFVRAGFTEDQAFEMVKEMMVAVAGGMISSNPLKMLGL